MFQLIKKWLSDRNNEITDKIDGQTNRDSDDSISINNDLLQIQQLKVFHSNQAIVQSLATNQNSLIKQNNNVINWFNNIKLRRLFLEKFNTLCNDSSKDLQLLETISSQTTLKVSRIRTENLQKLLKHSSDYAILNQSNQPGFRNIKYSIIKVYDSQSILLKVINSLVPCLVSGNPVILVAEDKAAIGAAFVVDLCERAGLMPGLLNLVITDRKQIDKIEETAKESNPSIFVLFESADVESSIERIATSYINDTLGSINVFVQQSIYKKLCQRMKARLTNMFEIGDQLNPKNDITSQMVVDYEAIDVENANQSTGIKVYQFRTNDEAMVLINHFIEVPYVSLWAEKASLALEFAKNINSTDNVYINCSLRYPVKKETWILANVADRVELDSLTGNKNNQLLLKSMLDSQTKWKTTSEEERRKIINEFVLDNELSVDPSVLQQSNGRISENKDNYGIQLVISHFEPIGLIVIRIDETGNQRLLNIVVQALLLGNSVVLISDSNPTNQLSKLSDYLSSSGKNILRLMNEASSEKRANAIVTSGHKNVGLYFDDISNVSDKLLKKLKKSITLPIGDISYAK